MLGWVLRRWDADLGVFIREKSFLGKGFGFFCLFCEIYFYFAAIDGKQVAFSVQRRPAFGHVVTEIQIRSENHLKSRLPPPLEREKVKNLPLTPIFRQLPGGLGCRGEGD